ncbi:hypothetical protein C7M61_002462 [Candidozyma pseudohaemuli]|uniref:Uncharacterized protein n=1 Tax=Candidozyma pseudohaemuli TaxID=418784 RepID=A0A2P7YRE5_9ASCO|nr:hypothetical protein C7M61_002462 [[Candida] pseudohaemulonii]PSK38529.1 hypothetical protein C7M61_002462 [[Candida] pseudohaemulonii]
MPPKTSYKQYVDSGLVLQTYDSVGKGPLDLDYLIHTLRHPTPDTSVQKVLGYMYHYLPFVKHEHNLRLVFSSFLNNQVCFSAQPPLFEENYLIIEVFKLITDKKLKISQPTLPIKTFYEVIGKELQSFVAFNPPLNSWKVLPIISGILLSNEVRDHLYTSVNMLQYKWFFNEWDNDMDALFKRAFAYSISPVNSLDIVNLSLLSLALKYHRHERLEDYVGRIEPGLLINGLVDLIFARGTHSAYIYTKFGEIDPKDPGSEQVIASSVSQKPVVKHLNRLSFILESLLAELPHTQPAFELILTVSEKIKIFYRDLNHFIQRNRKLNHDPSITANESFYQAFWFLMKGLLFAEVIIFQGILTRFLAAKNHNVGFFAQLFKSSKILGDIEREYHQICLQVTQSLYYTNFILMSVGQGGFDGYNFVYYLSIEILLHNSRPFELENITKHLIGNYQEINLHPDALNADYVARCKALYVCGLWENYLQQLSKKNPEFVNFIFEVAFSIVGQPNIEDHGFIEAVHSVLLVYFSTMENTDKNLGKVLQYFELLVNQFPRVLSANQLSVAVETLGKKILSNPVRYARDAQYKNSADEFLEFVYHKCSLTRPGLPVRRPNNQTFSSAQPVTEIDASSTLSQIGKEDRDKEDLVKRNKRKKPKDLPNLKLGLMAQGSSGQEYFENRLEPETSREAIILAFLNIIPYLPISLFVPWLDRIWALIKASGKEERPFLTERLWKVISENLDLNRCEIAYEWWYETRGAVEQNITVKLSQVKL